MKVDVKYILVTSFLGEHVNSSHPTSFDSFSEAVKCWEEEFRDRDKKDGYDEKWNKLPLRIQRIIEQNLWEN